MSSPVGGHESFYRTERDATYIEPPRNQAGSGICEPRVPS